MGDGLDTNVLLLFIIVSNLSVIRNGMLVALLIVRLNSHPPVLDLCEAE